MLHCVVRAGLGPATALPATLIELMPRPAIRLIGVVNPLIEVRTNNGGAVPGLNGLRVLEYSVVNFKPALTARCNSGYCERLEVNRLLAASDAAAMLVD